MEGRVQHANVSRDAHPQKYYVTNQKHVIDHGLVSVDGIQDVIPECSQCQNASLKSLLIIVLEFA